MGYHLKILVGKGMFELRMMPSERFGQGGFGPGFHAARMIPFLISLIWLGIGIRQWLVLSKWTRKYERYKELQKRIDEKLDFDQDEK